MKDSKVIELESATETPTDVAISRHIQNLFATYGEDKVRASVKELFGLNAKVKAIKKVS